MTREAQKKILTLSPLRPADPVDPGAPSLPYVEMIVNIFCLVKQMISE